MADESRWRQENRFDRDDWSQPRYDPWRGAGSDFFAWGRGPGAYGSRNRGVYPGSSYDRFDYGRDYGAPPYHGYGRDAYGSWGRPRAWDPERGFWDRASDEVSSWFGDDDAERRRELDAQAVNRRGRGPKGYIRSDERIREDVCDRLSDDPIIDASDVEVAVAGCEVTLTGTVDTREERRRAEDCAEHVSGVTHVQNNLRVSRGGSLRSTEMSAERPATTTGMGRRQAERSSH